MPRQLKMILCQKRVGPDFPMGYLRPVKSVIAIVCCLLLLAGQGWLASAAMSANCERVCHRPCCHAGAMPCCAGKSAPAQRPLAAAPLRAGMALPILFLLLFSVLGQCARFVVARLPVPQLACVRSRKVPLYARNCLRLI
jgi:hypothetical protein